MKKKLIPAACAAGLVLLSVFCLFGCQKKVEPISKSAFLLNTFVTVTLYDTDDTTILDHSITICKEYEELFSKTIPDSEIYRLNHRDAKTQTVSLSNDTASLLKTGLSYCELAGGAFDITVEPLSSLWDFTGDEHVIPEAEEIRNASEKVDYRNLLLDGNTLTFLSPDTAIDLGAIAKGYIADRIRDYLAHEGVKSAVINLGGNVLCVGNRPDGTPFRIGLQKPFAEYQETFETLNISDMSVVSSGVYERHFEIDGKNYHHILNPATGYPYDNGLISVTILSKDSVDGDCLSTACFSMGLEDGMKLVNSMDGVYACFIDEDYQVYYSDGFEDFIREEK